MINDSMMINQNSNRGEAKGFQGKLLGSLFFFSICSGQFQTTRQMGTSNSDSPADYSGISWMGSPIKF
jgi:hypothetical protein